MAIIGGLLGGLALFLFGMFETSRSLRLLTAGKLRIILGKLSKRRSLSMLVGVILAVGLQSSSAATAIVVGLCAAGALSLEQGLAVSLGAAIGTTFTVQILSFNPEQYALVGVVIGLPLILMGRYTPTRSAGRAVVGLSLVFFSMFLMKEAVEPVRSDPRVSGFLVRMTDIKVVGFLASMILTAVIQSSAATIGMSMALARAGLLSVEQALPIVLGANVGTCSSALISSIGTNREGVRLAVGHLLLRLVGAGVFLALFPLYASISRLSSSDYAHSIANSHTIFGLVLALGWLPFLRGPVRVLEKVIVIGRKTVPEPVEFLEAKNRLEPICEEVIELLREAGLNIESLELARIEKVEESDDSVDRMVVELSQAVKNSSIPVEDRERILRSALRLERIGDLASGELMSNVRSLLTRGLDLSVLGRSSLLSVHNKVVDVGEASLRKLRGENVKPESKFEAVLKASRDAYLSHIEQLRSGIPEAEETDKIFSEVLIVYEEIARYFVEAVEEIWRGS